MMSKFTYFKTFNVDDFESKELVAFEYEYEFEGFGLKKVFATKGTRLNVMIDDVFLSIELNAKNPFKFEGRAVFISPNNDVYIGIETNVDDQ